MLRSLQACRAILALIVVLTHTNNGIFSLPKYFGQRPFGDLFDAGPGAIDFFFVLSGFIIAYVHANDVGRPGELIAYLWKRFSRVYPFYWAMMAAVLPIYFLFPSFGFGYEADPYVIATSIFLFPHPQFHMVMGVAWTMVYEILFYLVFATAVVDRRLGIAVFAGWTLGIVLIPSTGVWLVDFAFHDMHLRFVAGVCVFLVVQRWRIPTPRLLAAIGVLGFIVTAMFDDFARPIPPIAHIVGYTLSSSITLAGLVQAERSGLLGAPQWLVYLGDATYAIYLVHVLALSLIAKVAKGLALDHYLPILALFALHVAGSIGIGLLCHHLVDQPLHAWTRRLFRRGKAKTAAPDVAVEPVRMAA